MKMDALKAEDFYKLFQIQEEIEICEHEIDRLAQVKINAIAKMNEIEKEWQRHRKEKYQYLAKLLPDNPTP